MLNDPDDLCYICNRPEKSKYIRPKNVIFMCSMCVINLSFRTAEEQKEKDMEEKERRKRKNKETEKVIVRPRRGTDAK